MGIVLKRRDNAKIVKIVVGGIVNYILNERSNQGAIDYTRNLIKQILRGEFHIDKFVISKTLKSDYKDRTRIVHAVLADRIGKRDPGNKPGSNDRVPYVYVVTKGKVMLQGDRVEDPKYVLENKLDLDYLFYITNQIMKPSLQFLELIAHNPEKLFDNYINKEINRRKNITSIYDYVAKEKELSDSEAEAEAEAEPEQAEPEADPEPEPELPKEEIIEVKPQKGKKGKAKIIKSTPIKTGKQSLTIEL